VKKIFYLFMAGLIVVAVFGTGVFAGEGCCALSGSESSESGEPQEEGASTKETVRKKAAEDVIETEYVQYKRELNNEEL